MTSSFAALNLFNCFALNSVQSLIFPFWCFPATSIGNFLSFWVFLYLECWHSSFILKKLICFYVELDKNTKALLLHFFYVDSRKVKNVQEKFQCFSQKQPKKKKPTNTVNPFDILNSSFFPIIKQSVKINRKID